MTEQDHIAPIGHNNPPPQGPYMPDDLAVKHAEFAAAAAIWAKLPEIEGQEQSQKAADFIAGAKSVEKLIDEERKRQKKPHDDAGKVVQEFFAPKVSAVKIAHETVAAKQAKWLKKENDRLRAEKAAAEKAAAESKAEAERLKAEAEARGDVVGMAEAEAREKIAAKEVKAAGRAPVRAKAESATGGGRAMSLRKVWKAEITNINHAFVSFRDRTEVAEVLTRLALETIRGQGENKTAPNGFAISYEEKAQ